jgi:UDP-N-acetylmuramate dehydrogenase
MINVQADYRRLLQDAEALHLSCKVQEPLARRTTFRIGGPADLYAVATGVEELHLWHQLARRHDVPSTVLGGGSNVLIGDGGIRGLVIGNAGRLIRREGNLVIAESGAALAGLARWAIREGLAGMEWAVSVPGTVGGGIIGNAGAHGSDVAANLAWVEVIQEDANPVRIQADALRYSYRSSVLKEGLFGGSPIPVVARAAFALTPGDPQVLAAIADANLERRRATQPVEPSAGSIFRNPPGDYAGRLIEACGLKGHRIGGAQVSMRHANFIINAGDARASDVRSLRSLIQDRVSAATGTRLMPEILFLGEF